MAKITILPHLEYCPEGKTFEAQPDRSIWQNLHKQDIDIDSACGGVCACTTCHVYIQKGYDSLSEPEEIEEDILGLAWGLKPNSRLSCQAIVGIEDIVVKIPIYSLNLAKEPPH